jgi:TfoX/Sxy family transcriptional regulator of competence genes
VAYDERLAERIRDLVADLPDVDEKKMFGGLAFLVGGAMAAVASRDGGFFVGCDPDEGDRLLAAGKASPMVMRGKAMRGWLRVDADAVRTARQLRSWIDRGVAAARARNA